MSQVQQFQFGLLDLRVVDIEGQPWFLAKDVLPALGMYGLTSDYTKRLLPDEKKLVTRKCLISSQTDVRALFTFKAPNITLVNEAALYKLTLLSRKPEAQAFQDWVTRVVLPAIRKDGAYIKGEEKVATGEMSDDELFLKALQVAQRKVDRYKAERDQLELDKLFLEAENQQLLPAAQVGQAVAKRKSLGVVDFCRKLPGVSVNAVQTRLYDMQYFHKKHGHWSVYAKFKGVLFDETFNADGHSKVIVLEAGQRKLVDMYHAGLLPMLKGRTPERHLELDV